MRAVAVDLDDTLYPQWDYLAGAARATAERAGSLGLPTEDFLGSYLEILRAGSDTGGTIDRALAALGLDALAAQPLVAPLVEAFVAFRPDRLSCFPGARRSLESLRRSVPVVLYTDGRPDIQRAKICALGLDGIFDLVLITDEALGRDRRKPDSAGLEVIAQAFGAPPHEVLVIGDRVDKDIEVARRFGARAIRVRSGEFAAVPTPDGIPEVASFAEAVAAVHPSRPRRRVRERRN
ncbi:MAG: HAD family hydrolase [Acidimicrobiaceae bacterium]|nr:HAD family hydrolase [Acidimicrobiaceae bacterium]